MYERGRTLSAYTTGPESDDRPFWPRHPLSRQAGKRRGWRSPKTRRGSDGRPLKATVITRCAEFAPEGRCALHRVGIPFLGDPKGPRSTRRRGRYSCLPSVQYIPGSRRTTAREEASDLFGSIRTRPHARTRSTTGSKAPDHTPPHGHFGV